SGHQLLRGLARRRKISAHASCIREEAKIVQVVAPGIAAVFGVRTQVGAVGAGRGHACAFGLGEATEAQIDMCGHVQQMAVTRKRGAQPLETAALSKARSGCPAPSVAWMYRWLATKWSGQRCNTRARAARTS